MGRKYIELPPHFKDLKPIDFRYVDKEYAIKKVRELGIKSARQYWKWFKEYKPAGFPYRPDRTYDMTWNEFLGTDNVYDADEPFAVRKNELLPYWDAVNIVQKLNIKSNREYRERFDRGEIPKGIPRFPDKRYRQFYENGGWYTFLGKNIQDKIEARKHLLNVLVLYHASQFNSNIIGIYIHNGTFVDLQKKINDNNINIIQIYNINDDNEKIQAFNIINTMCKQQNDNTWITNNLHGLLWELNNIMEIYNVHRQV